MRFDDIEVGHIYTPHDDGVYKIIEKGADYIIALNYSYNHKVATPWIYKYDDKFLDSLDEETDDYVRYIFDNMRYHGYDMLKSDY